jgi:hypothetical protein
LTRVPGRHSVECLRIPIQFFPFARHQLAWLVSLNGFDSDQLFGVWERQRTQEKRVHKAEDRRIGANAHAQCEYCCSREAQIVTKESPRIFAISHDQKESFKAS